MPKKIRRKPESKKSGKRKNRQKMGNVQWKKSFNFSVRDWFTRRRSRQHRMEKPKEEIEDDRMIKELVDRSGITNEEVQKKDPEFGDLLKIADGHLSDEDGNDSDDEDYILPDLNFKDTDYKMQAYSDTESSDDEEYKECAILDIEEVDDDVSLNSESSICEEENDDYNKVQYTEIRPVVQNDGLQLKSILKKRPTDFEKKAVSFVCDTPLVDENRRPDLSQVDDVTRASSDAIANQPIISQFRGLVNRTSISNLAVILSEFRQIFANRQHSFHVYSSALWHCLLRQLVLQPNHITNETLKTVCTNFAVFVAGLHRTVDGRIGEFVAHRLCILLVNESDDHLRKYAAMLGTLYATCVISYQVVFGYMGSILDQHNLSQQTLDGLVYLLKYHRRDLRYDDKNSFELFSKRLENHSCKPSHDSLDKSRYYFCWQEAETLVKFGKEEVNEWKSTRHELLKITKVRGKNCGVCLDFDSLCQPDDRFCLEMNAFDNADEDRAETKTEDYRLVAIKLQLRTPLRENIIKTILSSNDYIEACDNIASMRLNDRELKQVVVVVIKMALNERPFNEFYPLLLNRLTTHNNESFRRQMRLHIRRHVLDRTNKSMGLAILIARLIEANTIDLRVLKSFNWSYDQKSGRMEFLRNIVKSLLVRKPIQWFKRDFSRIARETIEQYDEQELGTRFRDFLRSGMLEFERVRTEIGEKDLAKLSALVEQFDGILGDLDE